MAGFTQREIDDVRTQAEILAAKANQALRVANSTNNVAGRQGCLIVVRAALAELKGLSRNYPFLSATNLSEFNRSIAKVEGETTRTILGEFSRGAADSKKSSENALKIAIISVIFTALATMIALFGLFQREQNPRAEQPQHVTPLAH